MLSETVTCPSQSDEGGFVVRAQFDREIEPGGSGFVIAGGRLGEAQCWQADNALRTALREGLTEQSGGQS